MNTTIALIDADILTYRVGFAIERDPIAEKVYRYNCDKMISTILHNTQCCKYKLFLTGKYNFRHTKTKFTDYKGNRKTAIKPKYYDKIRDYLVQTYNAEIIDGMEADDALGIAQIDDMENTIICSIDKDLLMIPGTHYNIKDQIIKTISENEAYLNFYRQMLLGDSTDNIPGLKGYGKIKVIKVLPNEDNNPVTLHTKVLDIYNKHIKVTAAGVRYFPLKSYDVISDVELCSSAKILPLEVFHELKRLLWIKRGNKLEDELVGASWQNPEEIIKARLEAKEKREFEKLTKKGLDKYGNALKELSNK